jgi:glyoxylase-like metal-dependent hydrolase (beta-lactamase superfamily II)
MKSFIKILIVFLVTISILFFFLSRGDLIEISDYPSYDNFVEKQLTPSDDLDNISISVIDTASAPSKKGMVIGGESMFEDYTISHSAILIQHPKGNILFDTGLGNQIDEQFLQMPSFLIPMLKYDFKESAASQLKDSGINIDNIFLSHLHWDHAGGVEDFIGAQVWTSKFDLDSAMLKDEGSLKSQLDENRLLWNFIEYGDGSYENFPESFDFYRDGSIVLVPMPGHTTGSIGMFVNLNNGKRYFLTGDVTYGLAGFSKPAEKSFILKNAIDKDNETLIHTILRVHYLMKKYPDLIVVPAHDSVVQAMLAQYPEVE